jgi:hypothetical protein
VHFVGAENPGTVHRVNAGNYAVQEESVFGYVATFSADCAGVIGLGQSKTCTVTNDDQVITVAVSTTLSGGGQTGASITVPPTIGVADQATLSGIRPAAGGTITYKLYSEPTCATLVFDATPTPNSVLNGAAPASRSFSSDTPGVFYWQAVYSGDQNNAGASSICSDERLTVVHTDQALVLVKKHVINDSGGSDATATAGSFILQVQTPTGSALTGQFFGSETGQLFELARGAAYNVVEITDPAPVYVLSYSADCTGTLQAGDVKTCTITNDDIPPARITVIKKVINNNGGTAVASNFQLQIQTPTGAGITGFFTDTGTGTLFELARGSEYKVVELNTPANYTVSYETTCTGTLAAGANVSCTVTNDDTGP